MATLRSLAPLDVPCFLHPGLALPRDDHTLQSLIDALWPLTQGPTNDLHNFRAYFAFLEWECRNCISTAHAATTFADLVEILNVVKANIGVPMNSLCQMVRGSSPKFGNITDDRKISASIEMAVRLCFMVNVRNIMMDSSTLRTALPWPDSSSLQTVIQNWQRQVSPTQQTTYPNFPSIPDLERIAGLQVRLTDDLMNHLEVDGHTLYIFHHVSVLRRIRESNPGGLFSPNFIDETLDTINLVLPISSPDCNAWVGRATRNSSVDPNLSVRKALNLGNFFCWGHRLSRLSSIFKQSSPSTVAQFWFDRRDMSKWWGFWLVAITVFLTVLFGLIQSVAGIMQVVVTMRPAHR
ncbi:hypothetical protein K469DRAFT_703042 [Zopfia rhizophila CBS 207.26]|uniref:Uncharacterized protein n=1 Tax=Zopfia rhizophila CBS 207.26 TaxID=1314779 RepID=A0A6A6E8Y5_9PEZI|nr:hypothetical protein K469DRAFT_703042 [Zopfia rhizophila CBS 207.26]